MLFDNWPGILRTLVVGPLAYIGLVALLRVSGKRTLSKMNAFDLVVTVALGSTLATILLSKDVALAEGLLAFALLILLQFVVTWTSVRVGWIRRMVTGEPRLLVHRGELLPRAMRQTRISAEEVRAAARQVGLGSLDGVEAIVLETDGSFSVVRRSARGDGSALTDVVSPRASRQSI